MLVALCGSGIPEGRGAGVSLVVTGPANVFATLSIQSACSTLRREDAMAYGRRVRVVRVLLVIALSFGAGAADTHYGEFEVSRCFVALKFNKHPSHFA